MSLLEKLQNSRNALGWTFMLPAAVLLIGLLAWPLGLGTWLGFTDAKIGRPGEWVGLENFKYLVGDSVTQLALFNTLFYTVVASILKFALGLWLYDDTHFASPLAAIASGGSIPKGSPWLAMEFLDGQSLAERVKQGGPLPPAEALNIAE